MNFTLNESTKFLVWTGENLKEISEMDPQASPYRYMHNPFVLHCHTVLGKETFHIGDIIGMSKHDHGDGILRPVFFKIPREVANYLFDNKDEK